MRREEQQEDNLLNDLQSITLTQRNFVFVYNLIKKHRKLQKQTRMLQITPIDPSQFFNQSKRIYNSGLTFIKSWNSAVVIMIDEQQHTLKSNLMQLLNNITQIAQQHQLDNNLDSLSVVLITPYRLTKTVTKLISEQFGDSDSSFIIFAQKRIRMSSTLSSSAGNGYVFWSQTYIEDQIVPLHQYLQQNDIKFVQFVDSRNCRECILDPLMIGMLDSQDVVLAYKVLSSAVSQPFPRIFMSRDLTNVFADKKYSLGTISTMKTACANSISIHNLLSSPIFPNSFCINYQRLRPKINFIEQLQHIFSQPSDFALTEQQNQLSVVYNITWMLNKLHPKEIRVYMASRQKQFGNFDQEDRQLRSETLMQR